MSEDTQALIGLTQVKIKQLSYEDTYGHLQRVLALLESGDLPLETSLKMYEVGTHLATHCAKTLEKAELQVQRWQEGGNTAPFDGWQGDESG
ncbi:MAG: exodeoxyribonuclease VII small subunit [Caldilineaceae bacterium]|nr:exodeoxyribonuclease VII small subunit [Caldilineaceae bacterium]